MSVKKYRPFLPSNNYCNALQYNQSSKQIKRYLNSFQKDTLSYNLINGYYKSLILRPKIKKMSLRSLYQALYSAINFLKYCQNFKEQTPTQYALEGYLFLYYEHKAVLTDFTNFISQTYKYNLDIGIIPKATFQRPRVSHQILKGRLIKILQNPHDKHFKEPYIFRTIIGYLHWIHIPQNVFISLDNIQKRKDKNYYLSLGGKPFYFPNQIVIYLIHRKTFH